MNKRLFLLYLIPLLLTTNLFAQERLFIDNGCHFDGDHTNMEIYGYPASNEAQEIISRITAIMGLEQNFIIKSANVANALATTDGGKRYILYNTTFLENFKRDARTQWAAYCVLAHEIGHHLNNHHFGEKDAKRRKLMELSADRFAGNILQKMGASLGEAQAGINTFALTGETATHPPKSARLEAVASAWKRAKEGVTFKVDDYVAPITVDKEKLAKEWFNKAYYAAEAKNYDKGIEFYTNAIRLQPDYAEAFNNRGDAKYKLIRYQEAMKDFDEAIRLKPDYVIAYNNRGIVKDNLGRYQEAIKDYDEAIRLQSDYASAFNNRGLTKNDLGSYEAAIKDFDEAIRLQPDNVKAFNNRGWAKYKLKKYEAAIKDYEETIRLNPKHVKAYANKGCAIVKMKDKKRMGAAIDLINRTLEMNPTLNYAKDCKKEALSILSK